MQSSVAKWHIAAFLNKKCIYVTAEVIQGIGPDLFHDEPIHAGNDLAFTTFPTLLLE